MRECAHVVVELLARSRADDPVDEALDASHDAGGAWLLLARHGGETQKALRLVDLGEVLFRKRFPRARGRGEKSAQFIVPA